MHVVHDRCRPIDVHMPWMMYACLVWCCLTLVDVAWQMRASHDRCHWVVTHTPWLMQAGFFLLLPSIGRYCLSDVHRHQLISTTRYYHTMAKVSLPKCTRYDWCVDTFVENAFHWPMLFARCVHLHVGAYHILLASLRRYKNFVSVHVGFVWSSFSLVDVPERCVHFTSNVCRYWLVLFDVGWNL